MSDGKGGLDGEVLVELYIEFVFQPFLPSLSLYMGYPHE